MYDDKIVNLKSKKTLNDTESFAVDDWDNPETYLDSQCSGTTSRLGDPKIKELLSCKTVISRFVLSDS